MFKKPFTVKKNTNMRNSEVRKLLKRLPSAVVDEFDKKVQIAHVKLMAFNNTTMNVYTFDKNPMFFDFDSDDVLFPTVYFSWKLPAMFPTLVVHEPVFTYLQNGADLMLPGVIRTEHFPLPQFQCSSPITISVYCNGKVKGPVAVGIALMSSQDMVVNGFHGKGVQILHVFRDFLWYVNGFLEIVLATTYLHLREFGARNLPPIHDSEVLMKCEQIPQLSRSDDFPPLGALVLETSHETRLEPSSLGILSYLRTKIGKSIFVLTDEIVKDDCQKDVELTCGPKIYEYYSVTEGVLPLMKTAVGVTKGHLLDSSDLCEIITCYVKNHKLNTGKLVRLDSILMTVINHGDETIDWNTLIQKIKSKMTKTFILRMPDGRELVRKISMPKIVFKGVYYHDKYCSESLKYFTYLFTL
uniref:PUA domain-containing protein n=1 Tax=Heterorhabditis bacteriophora TaxID=37862 RepID=A0A1I7WWI8_HETBA